TPAPVRIGDAWWSPDSRRIAFTVVTPEAVTLWLAEVESGRSRRLAEAPLNAAAGEPCAWVSATAGLVCRRVRPGRGPPPHAPETPRGPLVQEAAGKPAPAPTWEDLLRNPADEALFEHHYSSQLALVSLDGAVHPIGVPGLHVTALPSP